MEAWETIQQSQGRLQQLAQAGKRDIGLELHTSGGQQTHGPGLLRGVFQQRRLPDSGLATYDQARALPEPRGGQALIDRT